METVMAETQAGQENAQEQRYEDPNPPKSEGEDKGEEGGKKGPAPRIYTQEEVDRIANKIRKNARYLGRKEAEAELLKAGATPKQAQQATEPAKAAEPPKREDFPDYESFLEAKTDFTSRKAAREERAAAEKEASAKSQVEARTAAEREFKKHAQAVMEDIPDWAEVIEGAEDVEISGAMGEAITEAGAIGPRILYYLVQHPEEAARICAIKSLAAQAREIGKLEARIEAELAKKGNGKDKDNAGEEAGDEDKGGEDRGSEAEVKGEEPERRADGTFKPKKDTRKAPEPIEPGSGRSANTNVLPSDKDDVDTWLRKRNAELARERGG